MHPYGIRSDRKQASLDQCGGSLNRMIGSRIEHSFGIHRDLCTAYHKDIEVGRFQNYIDKFVRIGIGFSEPLGIQR